jgi:hypothetical protein
MNQQGVRSFIESAEAYGTRTLAHNKLKQVERLFAAAACIVRAPLSGGAWL